jgi:cytochrome c oxidase subunit 3
MTDATLKKESPTTTWGVWTLIMTEASLFGDLLFSYFYLDSQTAQHWPPEGLPKVGLGSCNTALLLLSSLWVWMSERALRVAKMRTSFAWLILAIVFGIAFVGVQCVEWHGKSYGLTGNLYGSLYFTITGFHMMHVVIGLIVLTTLLLWNMSGKSSETRLHIGSLYWHFVDAVWIFVFSTFYLVPYIVR